jgi:hypothetical protein
VATDINADGLFLATGLEAEPGELMQLVVELPDGPLQLLGSARFVGRTQSGAGIGVEIYGISDAGRARWLAYYEQLALVTDDPGRTQPTPAL